MGLIVQYWSTQSNNLQLSTVELGYKCQCTRVSDLARLVRDKTQILAMAMRYRYFGTKELRSVPVFTRQGGISRADCLRVCPVLAMQAYLDRTSSELYKHSDLVYPFQHVWMSQVPSRSTGYHFPVGA